MNFIFGIDGGGTRSRIRIENLNGDFIAYEEGESTNKYSVGSDKALNNLKTLIIKSCTNAGLNINDVSGACIGSAGLSRENEKEVFLRFLHNMFNNNIKVKLCSDAEILLVGGLKKLEGYALIGGTGSMALARSKDGKLTRAGGLGYMLGDEGSACDIGYTAIKRVLRSIESRDLKTNMLNNLLAYYKLNKADDFVAYTHNSFNKAFIAKSAPLVFKAAENNDILAMDIIKNASAELVLLVKSVAERKQINNAGLVISGGLLLNNITYKAMFIAGINKLNMNISIVEGSTSAEIGACMLAHELIDS